jgi:hypothetical protein
MGQIFHHDHRHHRGKAAILGGFQRLLSGGHEILKR